MKMKFNKFLSLCFICTLSMGAMTSCSDDDDDNGSKKEQIINDKYTVEQGREDGKNFGAIAKNGANMSVSDVSTLINLASKYKNTDDKVYKTAFAEGAGEAGLLGDTSKGDDAIAKVDEFINGLNTAEAIKNGTTEDKVSAIVNLLNLLNSAKQQ